MSILQNHQAFQKIIQTEISSLRYFGPFTSAQVIAFLGPFQSSLLTLMPKKESGQFHLIQNLFFPSIDNKLYSQVPSINSFISVEKYLSFFGTFFIISLTISNLPLSTTALIRDVRDVYRTILLHYSQWAGTVIQDDSHSFYINTANCFGLTSAGGI